LAEIVAKESDLAIIPEFLLRKVYRKGSLRETAEGIAFDLKNILGPGSISGINFIKINDMVYESRAIKILTSGIDVIADAITPDNPVNFRLNQEGTCLLQGAKGLKEGINKIIVELIHDAGRVQISLTDTV
jgi:hypothetical protein